jgi:formiminoglutamase
MDIFEHITSPNPALFFQRNDSNDPRLGEVVSKTSYEQAEIVIIGCPQDEGVRRNKGRPGAASAPAEIRRQFYKLTTFGINRAIFDLGDTIVEGALEEIHERHTQVVSQLLKDGKKVISLGGGNDVSYPDGAAMAENYGQDWIAINIDAHFDVRADSERNSGTPYRQLLEENLLSPDYFYEIAWQKQVNSQDYFDYLRALGVNMLSLEQLRSREKVDEGLRDMVKQKFVRHSESLSIFAGFDVDAVRASDAPGTSAPSPTGLGAGEFLTLVEFAAGLVNTKIIEFTEMNPQYDVDARTAKLVAVAMHRFCSLV